MDARPASVIASRRMGGTRPLLALGLKLARGGPLSTVAMVLAALGTLAMMAAAFVLRRSGATATLVELPAFAARLLAWGAGIFLAFASGVHALRRDRAEGIRALIRARGGSMRGYLVARVGGLVALLAVVVGGGTLLVALPAVALSGAHAGRAAQGALGALVYAIAFAVLLGPIALAALGARSRAGGYLVLLGVVVVPELLEAWTSPMMPAGWEELASIPAALSALGRAWMPPGVDLPMAGRALVVLGAVVAGALVVVRSQVARVDAEAER